MSLPAVVVYGRITVFVTKEGKVNVIYRCKGEDTLMEMHIEASMIAQIFLGGGNCIHLLLTNGEVELVDIYVYMLSGRASTVELEDPVKVMTDKDEPAKMQRILYRRGYFIFGLGVDGIVYSWSTDKDSYRREHADPVRASRNKYQYGSIVEFVSTYDFDVVLDNTARLTMYRNGDKVWDMEGVQEMANVHGSIVAIKGGCLYIRDGKGQVCPDVANQGNFVKIISSGGQHFLLIADTGVMHLWEMTPGTTLTWNYSVVADVNKEPIILKTAGVYAVYGRDGSGNKVSTRIVGITFDGKLVRVRQTNGHFTVTNIQDKDGDDICVGADTMVKRAR